MDINGVKEYGKLMDKMQVAYTNLVATMEWELFRRGAYSGFLDDIYMRKVSAILDRQSPLPTHVLAEKAHISPKCIAFITLVVFPAVVSFLVIYYIYLKSVQITNIKISRYKQKAVHVRTAFCLVTLLNPFHLCCLFSF